MNDDETFSQTYNLYVEHIYRYFIRQLRCKSDAEDLTSIVWEKVASKFHDFRPKKNTSLKSWIFSIARNVLIDFYRKNKQKSIIPFEEELANHQNIDKNLSQLELLKKAEQIEQLVKLIEALPNRQNEIISLYFFSDLSHQEIANALHIKEKTVSSHLTRGLQTLTKRLNDIV